MGLEEVTDQSRGLIEFVREKIAETANEPQRLWMALRTLILVDKASIQDAVLREVAEFCLAVYDSCEPDASDIERQQLIANAEGLYVPTSQKIGSVVCGLTAKDSEFLVKWGLVESIQSYAAVQTGQDIGVALSRFASFVQELNQVDNRETVMSIWLYALYTHIFVRIRGCVPAGMLGVAAFAVGVAIG